MSPEDTKLKIRVASVQHGVDWGTGMASREIRGHSFRLGDEHGYQRAIDDLKQSGFTDVDHVIEFFESRQKDLNTLLGNIP